jgi:rubredoxin
VTSTNDWGLYPSPQPDLADYECSGCGHVFRADPYEEFACPRCGSSHYERIRGFA